jgi:hypothetical protein
LSPSAPGFRFIVLKARFGHPTALAGKTWGILHPLDIFVFTPRAFEESAYEEHSFISVIAKQARIY